MYFKNLFRNLSIIYFIFISFQTVSADQIKIKAQIEVLTPVNSAPSVRISGKINQPQKLWTLIQKVANTQNLSDRVSKISFVDHQNQTINFKKISVSNFETEVAVDNWSYELKLASPEQTVQHAAHISWLAPTHGLMMLGDLLPDFKNADNSLIPVEISFVLPNNWKIASSEKKIGENSFSAENFINAVFLIGNFAERTVRLGKTEISLVQIGDWSFTADETILMTSNLLQHYEKIFGAIPTQKIQTFLLPLPQSFASEQWEAETRGASVIILSAVSSFKSRALAKLHEQLRHELFHLWIPNGLNLNGNYDWFYEGFALYEALKTGIKTQQIRFEDFLDALGRAFDISQRISQNKLLNLLDASRWRWSDANISELIYAKGMIVAFLCDLNLLKDSNERKSLDNIFRQLFLERQKSVLRQDGNLVILAALKNLPRLRSIIEKYVERNNAFDVSQELNESGLQIASGARFTRLIVQEKLNKRQKKLLENFGYQ